MGRPEGRSARQDLINPMGSDQLIQTQTQTQTRSIMQPLTYYIDTPETRAIENHFGENLPGLTIQHKMELIAILSTWGSYMAINPSAPLEYHWFDCVDVNPDSEVEAILDIADGLGSVQQIALLIKAIADNIN